MPTPLRLGSNGLTFTVLVEGEGPLVLLLHGFPDTAHTWSAVQPALAAQGFRVAAPFMRGYAPSDIPEGPFDSDTLGRDALGLIEALGAEHAIVLGHDWGATAAFSAAGLAPEKVKLLVTMAIPHPARVLPTPSMLWTVRHFFGLNMPGAAARIRARDLADIDMYVARWSPAWKVPDGETRAAKESLATPGSLEAAIGYYRALRPWLPASQRKKVTVPAIAFAGTEDNITPEAYERARPHYAAGYEVVRVPGGHFMHREHPEPFIEALTGVLASHRAT